MHDVHILDELQSKARMGILDAAFLIGIVLIALISAGLLRGAHG